MKANNSDGSSGLASSAAPSSKQKRKQMRKQKQEQFAREQEQLKHEQDKDGQGNAVGKMYTVQTIDNIVGVMHFLSTVSFAPPWVICIPMGDVNNSLADMPGHFLGL